MAFNPSKGFLSIRSSLMISKFDSIEKKRKKKERRRKKKKKERRKENKERNKKGEYRGERGCHMFELFMPL
jgi:hypothetical protein